MEPHRGPSRHTTQGSPSVSPQLHRMKERTSQGVPHAILCSALANTGCESVDTTVRKQRIVLAWFVTRMANERLTNRLMSGETDGGYGCSRVHTQRTRWNVSNKTYRCQLAHQRQELNGSTELTGHVIQTWWGSGRPAHEALVPYEEGKRTVAKRRMLEIQTAQQPQGSS